MLSAWQQPFSLARWAEKKTVATEKFLRSFFKKRPADDQTFPDLKERV